MSKAFTIRLSDRQLKETIRALRIAPINPEIREEVTQKLGAAFVTGGDERSEAIRPTISGEYKPVRRDDAARVIGSSPGPNPWRRTVPTFEQLEQRRARQRIYKRERVQKGRKLKAS